MSDLIVVSFRSEDKVDQALSEAQALQFPRCCASFARVMNIDEALPASRAVSRASTAPLR